MMNWGKGITIALIAFVGFIVYLVVVLMSHNVDLESEDYYQREIAYENEIEAIKNANKLTDKITIKTNETHVIIGVPEGKFTEVNAKFERPNDDTKDRNFTIDGTKTYTIDKSELEKGKYNVKITYTTEGKPCLQKEQLYID